MSYRHVADATFISGDYALLLLNGENNSDSVVLELFSLTEGRRLRQFNFPFRVPVQLALLMKPPMSHYGDNCPSSRAKMFIPDPDLDIVQLLFHTACSNYVVVISIKRLFKCHMNEEASDTPIEWSHWGPTTTSWLPPGRNSDTVSRSTFGSRMVARERMRSITGHWIANSVTLFDFNPRPIRRKGDTTNSKARPRRVVVDETKPSTWLEPLSEIPIDSTLPFRAFCSDTPTRYLSFLLDSNTIIGCAPNSFDFFSFLPDTPETGHETQFGHLSLTMSPMTDEP